MGDKFHTHMICCTDTICEEVRHKEITRKNVALSYALALRSAAAGADAPDWSRINRAIIDRWSMSALEWIKARALRVGKSRAGRLTARSLEWLATAAQIVQ